MSNETVYSRAEIDVVLGMSLEDPPSYPQILVKVVSSCSIRRLISDSRDLEFSRCCRELGWGR